MVARQAHNLKVDVFKSILRNQEDNRPICWVFLLQRFFTPISTNVINMLIGDLLKQSFVADFYLLETNHMI